MELFTIPVGLFQTNCYILKEENEIWVIDPGDGHDAILDLAQREALKVRAVIVTHGHLDHFSNAARLAQAFEAPLYFPEEEVLYLDEKAARRGPYIPRVFDEFKAALSERGILVKEGCEIRIGSEVYQVQIVPGHTRAGMCLLCETAGRLFSGDCLFRESIGRTDLFSGPSDELIHQLKKRMASYPDSIQVYPGHGPQTTIGWERRNNPFLQDGFQ